MSTADSIAIASPPPSRVLDAGSRWFLIAGGLWLALALALLAAHLLAFELILALLAAALSTDGVVEATNRRIFSATLIGGVCTATLAALASFALAMRNVRQRVAAAVAWDPLRRHGLDVPNPFLVLVCSSMLGALFVTLWPLGRRLGGFPALLYQNEGPLELLTVVLELAAVVLCIVAARRWKEREPRQWRAVPALCVTLAVTLFFVAMEELNWGQTLLGFETPPAWAAINHQQQTSLHNLLDAQAVSSASRALALMFGAGLVALIALAIANPASVFSAIAPPASLAGLAAFVVYGSRLHAEVLEILLAIFFTFYSYRIYLAARSSARQQNSG